jgi:hypothetical protein
VSPRAFPDELLQRPMSERLAYFRSYTVAHPQLKAVSEALRRAIQEPGGASLIFVVGPTGVGKTTLRLRIERELKEQFLSAGEPEPGRIPVVGSDLRRPHRTPVISAGRIIIAGPWVRSTNRSSITSSTTRHPEVAGTSRVSGTGRREYAALSYAKRWNRLSAIAGRRQC